MKLQKLLEDSKEIDLKSKGVYLGEESNMPNTVSVFKRGEVWVLKRVHDNQASYESVGSEDEICEIAQSYIALALA